MSAACRDRSFAATESHSRRHDEQHHADGYGGAARDGCGASAPTIGRRSRSARSLPHTRRRSTRCTSGRARGCSTPAAARACSCDLRPTAARTYGDSTRARAAAHARTRVPGAEIIQGELEQLPYDDASFDVVTGFNSFQYAARPEVALAEARRAVRPGGRVLLLNWAPAELCEAAGYLMALGALMPPPPPVLRGRSHCPTSRR